MKFLENYGKSVEELKKRGVPENLLNMPAIRERLEKSFSDPNEIVINSDGTFNFDKYYMKKIEKDGKEYVNLQSKYKRTEKVQYAMDDPIGDGPYDRVTDFFESRLINDKGIEEEYRVKEMYSTDDKNIENLEYDNINYKKEEIFKRENGKISLQINEKNDSYNNDCYVYDTGDWKIEPAELSELAWPENKNKISSMLHIYDNNSSKIVKKYPELKDYFENGKEELLGSMDKQIANIVEEKKKLELNVGKLQNMLQKTLTFAETVRDSRIGKLFFEGKAKEILGDRNSKDTKKLDYER